MTELKDPAKCKYCKKIMPEFGESEGLSYICTECTEKRGVTYQECFTGKVVKYG
jgi:hypothetical protein